MKKLWTLLFSFSSLWAVGQAQTNEIIIQSELSSPVVLVNDQSPNYLKVSLKGFPVKATERPPLNLALVVDRSGSMSGDRIEKAREAAIMAVEVLGENDTLSIIAYDSGVDVIVPATKIKNKKEIIQKINKQLTPRGATALFAGLSKGIGEASKNLDPNKVNRIILLSDGQANVGPTSTKELSELAKIAAQKGIAVSTFGIGNDYNEDLMTAISNYSDGNHAYVANVQDLELIMEKEFKDSMSVAAQNFEIIIELKEGAKPIRLLGRDGEIRDNKITVNMNQVYANQEKHVLLELEPMAGSLDEEKLLANVDVRYTNAVTKQAQEYKMPVNISYTDSQEFVADSVQEDVLVESIVQKIAMDQEKAAELIQEGKFEESKDVLEFGDGATSALRYATGPIMLKSEDRRQELEKRRMEMRDYGSRLGLKGSEDLGNGTSINEVRKSLKESSFKAKNQQD